MKIESGKTYRNRDGRKASVYEIKKLFYSNESLAYYTTEEGHDEVVYASSGRGNDIEGKDHPVDLIEEWQDEPKKEISDMSEVKFKVGDVVSWKLTELDNAWQNFKINKIDEKNKLYHGTDSISGDGAFCFHWEIELVNKDIPEPNTKWVFNDGQDFVVRVVGFNDKGQIVLEVLENKNRFALLKIGSFFTFENEPENFGHFYKPWVEKVEEPTRLVGYVSVVKQIGTGRLDFDASVFDTEQEARDGFDSWTGTWELVDVVKVEWEES